MLSGTTFSPVFLGEHIFFPDPSNADSSGLIAFGGDLSIERLLLAYQNGIFPWYSEPPILWWCPSPRFVLFPNNVKISKSLKKVLKRNPFRVTFNTHFHDVISMCGKLRQGNTWITTEMTESYCSLHTLGYAESVEVWNGSKLVGGLYGVVLGRCFFGESMFSVESNASKIALVVLCQELIKRNFILIDCQVYSSHLESMGAVQISRDQFLELIKD
ncbi:hypothetical protein RCL1_006561 [Eukaryota sp. TZLM3-RCL]